MISTKSVVTRILYLKKLFELLPEISVYRFSTKGRNNVISKKKKPKQNKTKTPNKKKICLKIYRI